MRVVAVAGVASVAAGVVWLLSGVCAPRVALLLGGLIAIGASTLVVVARVQLGRAFAVAPRAKALVSRGLYSRVSHPLYVFVDLALLGVILAFRVPLLLVGWACLVAAHVWQASREERILEQAFGEAYRAYRRRTLL